MKKGLGRGLGALLDIDNAADTPQPDAKRDEMQAPAGVSGGVLYVDIRKIEPNRHQPRQYFEEESLRELADSIKSVGVIQPLIVNERDGHFAIIAGERRFRAARMAKLTELPVIVKEYSEMETLQIALIENIQRQDLTPIEEATCYKRLMEDFFFSTDDIAAKIGRSKHSVSGAVKLLELDERVQQLVGEGKLTASHARVFLTVRDGDMQYAAALKTFEEGLSVRGAEALVAAMAKAEEKAARQADKADDAALSAMQSAYRRVESELMTLFGAKVNIRHGEKKGKIEIEYYSPEELDRLLCLFKGIK